jgi:hypothetical protein
VERLASESTKIDSDCDLGRGRYSYGVQSLVAAGEKAGRGSRCVSPAGTMDLRKLYIHSVHAYLHSLRINTLVCGANGESGP